MRQNRTFLSRGLCFLFSGALLLLLAFPQQAEAQISSFPHITSFEVGGSAGPWDGWTRSNGGFSLPFWTQEDFSTPSSSTGPSGPQDGSYYVFLETSYGSTGATSYLTANFNFTGIGNPEISFYYHMYGSNMGSLYVEVSTNSGASWTSVWSRIGQQHTSSGAPWTFTSQNIAPQAANQSNVLIRFRGVRGTGFRSDMAIDLVKVYNAVPMTYTSSTTTQDNTDDAFACNNQEILGIQIVTSGSLTPLSATSLSFNTAGTTNPAVDISAARVFYTGNDNTYAAVNQFGSSVSNPNGAFSVTGSQMLEEGTNYFWLVYDIPSSAVNGHVVDAQCPQLVVDAITRIPTVTSPAGNREIRIISYPYFETFEGGAAGWTSVATGGIDPWELGTPAQPPYIVGANSGVNAWMTDLNGNYPNNANAALTSPCLSFTSLTAPVFTFFARYRTENSWDGWIVEGSTNGGTSWVKLTPYSPPYNNSSTLGPIPPPKYSSNSSTYYSQWNKHVFVLPAGYAGNPNVKLRIRFGSDGSVQYPGVAIDDIGIGNFPQKDIAVDNVLFDNADDFWARKEGHDHPIRVRILNLGFENNPSTVSLVYKEGSPPANSTDGMAQTFTPSWLGSEATVTFSTPFIPSTLGPTTVYVKAFYSGDGASGNDDASDTRDVQSIRVHGYSCFDGVIPPGFDPGPGFDDYPWTVTNLNGGAEWQTMAGTGMGGSQSLAYPGDVVTADDWVFTPAALLQAGSSYRVQFQLRSRSGLPQVLDFAFGTSPSPGSMTVVETFTFSNTGFTPALTNLGIPPFFNTDPSVAQDYYLGFRVRSSGGAGPLDIDCVKLDDNPTPPPKIGYGPPGTPEGMHVDDPAVPLQLHAVYKKAGIIMKEFEVVSTTYKYGAPGDMLWTVTSNDPWIKVTLSQADPTQFLTNNPYSPDRPRQLQTFMLEVDPTMFPPGIHTGSLTFYATLYNLDFPNGIKASNEPFNVPVVLQVTDVGSGKTGMETAVACYNNMTVGGSPYLFKDGNGITFAAVNVTGGQISSMCIEVHPNAHPAGFPRYRFANRYFQITATGSWTADVDFFYTDTEAMYGGVTYPDFLRGIRQPVPGGRWEDPTFGTWSESHPGDYFVRVHDMNPGNIAGNHMLVHDWLPFEVQPKADAGDIPTEFALGQNYPNPFNPTTKIDFSVPEDAQVRLVVFNNLGVEVARLVDGLRPAGMYTVSFDASDLPTGFYTYRLTAGTFTETKRMLFSK